MSLGDDGGAIVAAMLAIEARIDEENASVLQRDERAFTVSRIAWSGR